MEIYCTQKTKRKGKRILLEPKKMKNEKWSEFYLFIFLFIIVFFCCITVIFKTYYYLFLFSMHDV